MNKEEIYKMIMGTPATAGSVVKLVMKLELEMDEKLSRLSERINKLEDTKGGKDEN